MGLRAAKSNSVVSERLPQCKTLPVSLHATLGLSAIVRSMLCSPAAWKRNDHHVGRGFEAGFSTAQKLKGSSKASTLHLQEVRSGRVHRSRRTQPHFKREDGKWGFREPWNPSKRGWQKTRAQFIGLDGH